MKWLFRKNREKELIFDTKVSRQNIKEYLDYLISKQPADVDSILSAFNEATATYDNNKMGDFISHLNLYVEKTKSLFANEDIKKVEIEHYIEQLSKFKLSLISLSNRKLSGEEKQKVCKIVELIKNEFELKKKMFAECDLPINHLNIDGIDTSFLRKNKKYIVAITLLHMYNYESLNFLCR